MQPLEVNGAVRPLYGSLGVKGLTTKIIKKLSHCIASWCVQFVRIYQYGQFKKGQISCWTT